MPGLFEKARSKVQNLIKPRTPDVDTSSMKMSICMLGPRGSGKTSVITSMYNGQREAVEGTDLFLIAQGKTGRMLSEKKQCLEAIFSGYHEKDEFMQEGGIAGDSQETTFSFVYGMNTQNVNISLEIRDYPGEYLLSNPRTVAQYVREANAVLVAIDTPCLMEEGGRFNRGKNKPELVSRFLMENLPQGDEAEEKLVLMVPLKCERYALDGRLGEVEARIREVYADLFDFLRDKENAHGLRQKICCVITPIQTLGGVQFHSFAKDMEGCIDVVTLDDGSEIPAGVNYSFVTTDAGYQPESCAQPLYYLLSFIAKQYQSMKEAATQTKLLSRLSRFFAFVPHIDEFCLEAAKLGSKRIQCGAHDVVLFGRGRI